MRWLRTVLSLAAVALAGLVDGVAHGQVALAQAGPPASDATWLVVASAQSESHLAQAQSRAEELESALRGQDARVIPAGRVRATFVASHSSDPVELPLGRERALLARVERATHVLALGRLDQATVELAELRSLSEAQQDALRRAPGNAEQLFDVCVVSAGLLAEQGDEAAADRQFQTCARAFPAMRSAPSYHAPETRERYARAAARLSPAPGGARLRVRSIGGGSCIARVNGTSIGRTPTDAPLLAVDVRVQLECDDRPGRVHRLELKPGVNELALDAAFESALRSGEPRLGLLHRDAATLQARRVQDAAQLAGGTRASVVILVEVTSTVTVVRVDPRVDAVRSHPWSAELENSPATVALARSLLTAPSGPPAPARPPARAPQPVADTRRVPLPGSGALPLVRLGQSHGWVVPATIALGYSATLGFSLFALARRADERKTILDGSSFDIEGYRAAQRLGVIGTAAGAAVASGMEVIGLEGEGMPWHAWVATGLGAASLAAGLLLSPDPRCEDMVPLRSCTTWAEDPLLGTLLVVESIPLLVVPLTYALAPLLGRDTRVSADSAGLRVTHRF